MLNPFPSLLIFIFFVPTILRIVAAVTLLYVAVRLIRSRRALASVSFPLIGKAPAQLVAVSALVTALVALCLFLGYATQWAAIVGAIISFKQAVLAKRYPALPLPRSTYVLLGIICLTLLFSGAGALAFDLPL
jgi:uncharacterized membrane protein YphA (DoxX/SURF4 family)